MTHYEQFQNMSIEELAEFLDDASVHCEKICAFTENGKCNSCDVEDCPKGIKKWLESEA